MVDTGRKVDFRWLERVIGREVYGKKEDTTRVWAITLLHTTVSLLHGLVYHSSTMTPESARSWVYPANVQVPLWLLASETSILVSFSSQDNREEGS